MLLWQAQECHGNVLADLVKTSNEKVYLNNNKPKMVIFFKGEGSPILNLCPHKMCYDQISFCCLEQLHALIKKFGSEGAVM